MLKILEDIAVINYRKGTQSNNALNILHITQERVAEILLSVPQHKAIGVNGISAKLLKITSSAISSHYAG